jgi:hypothetical protein
VLTAWVALAPAEEPAEAVVLLTEGAGFEVLLDVVAQACLGDVVAELVGEHQGDRDHPRVREQREDPRFRVAVAEHADRLFVEPAAPLLVLGVDVGRRRHRGGVVRERAGLPLDRVVVEGEPVEVTAAGAAHVVGFREVDPGLDGRCSEVPLTAS